MEPLDKWMKVSEQGRRSDGDGTRVLKGMEPHMICDSDTAAATSACRKLEQLEEEKYKLLRKNLILELELRQLEAQREKLLKKSHRGEEKVEQLEEDHDGPNETRKTCEERSRQLEADLNVMMKTTQTMEAKTAQLRGSNAALVQMDDSLDRHIKKLEQRKAALCEKHQRREMVLIQMEEKTQALKDVCLSLRKNRTRSSFHFFKSPEAGQTLVVEENERKKKMQSLFARIRKRLNRKRKEMKAASCSHLHIQPSSLLLSSILSLHLPIL